MHPHDIFMKRFTEIDNEVKIQELWDRGFNYLNASCIKRKLNPGEVIKSIDDRNRKLILIGTPIGPFIVLELNSNGDMGSIIINRPFGIERVLDQFTFNHDITLIEEIKCILGDPQNNIVNIGDYQTHWAGKEDKITAIMYPDRSIHTL